MFYLLWVPPGYWFSEDFPTFQIYFNVFLYLFRSFPTSSITRIPFELHLFVRQLNLVEFFCGLRSSRNVSLLLWPGNDVINYVMRIEAWRARTCHDKGIDKRCKIEIIRSIPEIYERTAFQLGLLLVFNWNPLYLVLLSFVFQKGRSGCLTLRKSVQKKSH